MNDLFYAGFIKSAKSKGKKISDTKKAIIGATVGGGLMIGGHYMQNKALKKLISKKLKKLNIHPGNKLTH